MRVLLALGIVLLGGFQVRAQIFVPESGTHSWNSASNWRDPSSIPNAVGATATFENPSSSPGALTVTLDAAITIGHLSLTNNTTHTRSIAPGTSGSLTLANTGSSPATITFSGTGNSSVSISSSITLNSHLEVTISNAASVSGLSISGVISGSQALTKGGTGLLVLTGENTYSGTTTLNAGTTIINGNQSAATGSVIVNNTARLGGTGQIGEVTVNAGGVLYGGTGGDSGTLSAAGIVFEADSILQATIGASSASRVNAGDVTLNLTTGMIVRVVGSPGLTRSQLNQWTLAFLNNADNLFLDGENLENSQVIGRFTQGSGPSGAVVVDVANLGITLETGDLFELYRSEASIKLRFVPVPEPTSLVAILGSGLALGWLVRRSTLFTVNPRRTSVEIPSAVTPQSCKFPPRQ